LLSPDLKAELDLLKEQAQEQKELLQEVDDYLDEHPMPTSHTIAEVS
jgi:hypothetical protein